MRTLVLSWDARAAEGGLDPQAAGLAAALADAGDDVRLVTRLGEDHEPPVVPGVEVHAVADAPPIVPAELDGELLAAHAFGARATSVAVRRLEERPVDVVHAFGWQTGPVVAALQQSHGAGIVLSLPTGDLDAGRSPAGVVATATQLLRNADLVVSATTAGQQAVAATSGRQAALVPPGADLPARSPGPPPAAGPVHLVTPRGTDHRRTAADLRTAASTPRRITRTWRRRPFAVVVLDPDAVTAAARALALGVPLLACEGPVGELAVRTGGGIVVEPTGEAVAGALDQLEFEPALAATLGGAGAAAATSLAWPLVAGVWRSAVTAHLDAPLHAPLHAAG